LVDKDTLPPRPSGAGARRLNTGGRFRRDSSTAPTATRHSRKLARSLPLAVLGLMAGPVAALDWVHTNVQALYGEGFILGEHRRATATLEHAHGWRYGDNFFFVDLYNHLPSRGGIQLEAYGEWYSTLSLNKVFGLQSPIPGVSDIAFSAGINAGSRPTVDPYLAFLGGMRLTFDLPGFEYLQFYTQAIQIEKQTRRGVQFTGVWSLPLSWAGLRFKFRGFMDVTSPAEAGDWHILAQPQLVLDIGAFADVPETWFFGVEWWYWHNKFGIPGANESAPQATLVWFF
jgi:nucleoside-specific outer membrane channel protein Tsx